MSAYIAQTCIKLLRMRRHLDVDALTVWAGVMTVLAVASGASLAMA